MKKQKSFTQHHFLERKHSSFSRTKNGAGFTIAELLLVVAIIGLFSSIVLASTKTARERAKRTAICYFAAQVHHALGAYAVGIWDFDEKANDTCLNPLDPDYNDICDRSGYGNHGRNYGFGWNCGNQDTPCWSGCATYNLPATPYVDIQSSESLKISRFPITLAAWVYSLYPFVSDTDAIIQKGSGGWVFKNYYLGRINSQLSVGYGDGVVFRSLRYENNFPENEWKYVVGVIKGPNNMDLYMDGVKLTDTTGYFDPETTGNPWTNNVSVKIASLTGDIPGGGYYTGLRIDDIRIYTEALSSAQIQKLYVEGAIKHGLLTKE